MTKKTYPLEIVVLRECDGGSFMAWISKGHHDAAAFLAAVEEYEGELPANPQVRHEYRRMAWCGGAAIARFPFWDVVQGPERGAFPVTILEL
jgi:hypothetical protein